MVDPAIWVFAVLAVVAGFRLATAFSQAGRIARPLQALVGCPVRVDVRGQVLAGPLVVEQVSAFGVGLLIWLTPRDGKRTLLKIAQPGPPRSEGQRVIIEKARYVQWEGRRLPAAAAPAFVLEAL